MLQLRAKTGRLAGLAALVVLLGLGAARPAPATEVVLRVDGLACPFCAFGVEKKLLNLPVVEAIDIRMNEGKVLLALREGEPFDVAALDEAVADAGFTLRRILVEDAVGQVSRHAGDLVLRSSRPLATFRLRGAGEALPDPGSTVAASGTVEEFDSDPVLIVTSLRPIGDAPAGSP